MTATAAATAQVAGNQAVEHAADAVQEAKGTKRAARPADVVAIGLHRHGVPARAVGHRHIVPPADGGRWPDDSALVRLAAGIVLSGYRGDG